MSLVASSSPIQEKSSPLLMIRELEGRVANFLPQLCFVFSFKSKRSITPHGAPAGGGAAGWPFLEHKHLNTRCFKNSTARVYHHNQAGTSVERSQGSPVGPPLSQQRVPSGPSLPTLLHQPSALLLTPPPTSCFQSFQPGLSAINGSAQWRKLTLRVLKRGCHHGRASV